MNFTLICPNCGTRLTLFDSQIKAKKGTVRCTRCGNRVRYDLTKPGAGQAGFWPETAVPFKPGAQNRFLSIAKAQKIDPDFKGFSAMPAPETTDAPRIPPAFSREQNSFQSFDLKTGQVIPSEKTPAKIPSPSVSETKTKTPPPASAKISHPPKEKPNSTAPARRKKAKRMKSALPKIPKSTGTPVTVQNKQSFLARLGQLFRKFFG